MRYRAPAPPRTADPEQPVIAQRNRQDRLGEIRLVAVLVHPHPRALAVEIHQTALRRPGAGRKLLPDSQRQRRDRRPGAPGRMARDVAITPRIGIPSERPGTGHPHRHPPPSRRQRRKQRRRGDHLAHLPDQRFLRLPPQKPLENPHPSQRHIRPGRTFLTDHCQNPENDSLFPRPAAFRCLRLARTLPIYAGKPGCVSRPGANLGSETGAFGVGLPNIAKREE